MTAEIERLRREHLMMQDSVALGARKIEALTKANAEMREALKYMIDVLDGPDDQQMLDIAYARAQTALARKP